MSVFVEERQRKETLATALVEARLRSRGWDLLAWTSVHRRMLKVGVPFDLTRHAYMRAIYESQARRLVVYKASQLGASEYAISYALHAADARGAQVLYVFPTDDTVSDFSSARIGPAIEASPYLEGVVIEGGAAEVDGHKPRGADRVTLKRIRDRFIYLRGGQVKPDGKAHQLKSIDADVLILDEVDEMDPRAPSIAVKRLGHSLIAEERWISTPTYPGLGIHAAWLLSDMREWFVRCGSCGKRQMLSIASVIVEWDEIGRPVSWNKDSHGRAIAACQKCGKKLNRLGPGEWVAQMPGRDTAGFHLTKLFSPTASLAELIENLQTTDETKRREAFNQDLGETYTPRGGQITDDVLDACRRDYGHGPVPGERTILGADVGKVLHVVIRTEVVEAESGERRQRFAGEVESFETLGRLMRDYNVGHAVIDALPETRKARELQEDFPPHVVWLAYYVGQKTGTKRTLPEQWVEAEGVVNLDRTRTLDRTMSRFFERKNTLPAYARDVVGGDYYAHMKAPVRVLQDGPGGEKVAVYVESSADHFVHAENYCEVAASRFEPEPAGAMIDDLDLDIYKSRRRR